ncbi:MAG: tRNA dihydrouridine synthase [Candidatus Nanoarchaeia archaeon]
MNNNHNKNKIGNVVLENPFVLAPMAGVNCSAFRLMCRESGAALIYTQMYHSDFLLHKLNNDGKKSIFELINIQEKEKPVTVQLIGNNPKNIAKAAKIVEEVADIIDINFGCCDPNMLKAQCGGFFSKESVKMKNIIEETVKAVSIPVTAKIRIGWDSQSINGVETAQLLENSGVKAIAVHGRTVKQKYGGKANWQIIKQIKEKLSIPVIGNGDVNNAMKAMQMLNFTGCDMVMIGRRTKGEPEFFKRCLRKYENEEPKIQNANEQFLKFLGYYEKLDKNKSFTEIKAHAMWFAKRANLGPRLREKIAKAQTIEEVKGQFLS